MTRACHFIGAFLMLGLLLRGTPAGARPPEPRGGDEDAHRAQLERVRRMTPRQLQEFQRDFKGKGPAAVRDRLGPPQRVARQVFYQCYLEQWVYDGVCRVEFVCPLGREAQFQSIHLLSGAKR